jgi:hypothetical protein
MTNIAESTNLMSMLGINFKAKSHQRLIKEARKKMKWYFNKYHLESDLEELQETIRIILDPAHRKEELFYKDYNLTEMFISSVKRHVQNHSNAIFMIHGLPNSGKSEVAQSIAKIIEIIAKKCNLQPTIHIFFDITEIPKRSKEFKEGDIIIVDEMPALEGTGAINIKKSMDNITKIVRQKQLFFVFNSPELIRLKVINYYVETYGKYKEKRKSRCRIYDKKCELIGIIYLKVHKDEAFRAEYLRKKADNIQKILKTGGQVVGKINVVQLETDIKALLKEAEKYQIEKLGGLQFIATMLGFDGDNNYVKSVVQGAWLRVQNGSYEFDLKAILESKGESYDETTEGIEDTEEIPIDKQPTELPNHVAYHTNMTFAEFVYDNERKRCSPDVAKCRSMFVDGKTYDEIKEELNKSDDWVHYKTDDWKSAAQGDGENSECWRLFEKWFAVSIGADPNKCGGNEHKPDVVHEGEIYSLKVRFDRSKTLTFYQSKDFKQEYDLAKNTTKRYHVILLNPFWRHDKFKDLIVNVEDEDKVVIVKGSTYAGKPKIILGFEKNEENNNNSLDATIQ